MTSSPPARGSSHLQDPIAAVVEVVPARAGIFRDRRCFIAHRSRRPRPRGDLPHVYGVRTPAPESSPPARGSSGEPRQHDAPEDVVPARAGIFLDRAERGRGQGSRPRPRGDLPRVILPGTRWYTSSPPARGSSTVGATLLTALQVVPARAGIFPASRDHCERGRGRPRPRGDLPSGIGSSHSTSRSSPHARGSFTMAEPSRAEPIRRRSPVVPARARIFPTTRTPSSTPRGRPRTRGDLPTSQPWAPHSFRSSPHTRGSSPLTSVDPHPPTVVPARARMFPSCRR